MGALALEMAAKGSTSEDVNVVNAFVVIFLDACFHLFCGAIPSPDGDAPPDVARNFRSRVGQLLPMSLDALGAYSDEQIVELVKVWAESKRGPKGPRGSSAGSKFERLAAFAKTLGVYVAPDTLQDEAERHRKNLGVREREFFGWMRDNYNSQRKVERSSVGNKKD